MYFEKYKTVEGLFWYCFLHINEKGKLEKGQTLPMREDLPGGTGGKETAASAGDERDTGLIPGSRRSPAGGHATHSSILSWRIPWAEEPGRLQKYLC